ncbi:MAG TPA: EF-P beta-lysylation protein EpmB [Candidatus Thiothrix moscowensis]|uniref:EF-P beta-lysylation protein EpmB n=1 Tax=unclassified Thiothrix TaxID=2636184 RepID=UPI0025D83C8E|nr:MULTISPECIES: EF-P beta-lysylation protein EpmB [unclassified Thiothrix]HRJ53898.1 EF-P beta-lysylation protein EpmB [Candidatus Thiothrix moscowensis]HRJ93980.1 EF-P beta-lysylation protein EpmB [Candidatus Thiothrix moscowensis]
MITGIQIKNQVENVLPTKVSLWQRELAGAVREPAELLRLLGLEGTVSTNPFRLLVPHSYIARMKHGDWHDPLLRQVLPLDEELRVVEGFNHDPVGDQFAQVADGVLHKYHGRVLLVTTGACAVHCRYCFRRHFPYTESNPVRGEWEGALAYIRANADVREVILSGGDPLTLSDERLAVLFRQLRDIPHVTRVRFHSRLPVVLPSRIDSGFLSLLEQVPQQKVMVIHANHAQELAAGDVRTALAALHGAGVTLLNQAVLLRGVNDNADVLVELSESLFAQRVLPYYLHLLDRVAGAAHFEVPEAEAARLMGKIRQRLPGFLVPKLVREVAGERAKMPVSG